MGRHGLFQGLYSKYLKKYVYSKTPPGDTVFSVTSQYDAYCASSRDSTTIATSASTVLHEKKLHVSKGRKTSGAAGSSLAKLKMSAAGPRLTLQPEVKGDLPVNSASPSPDAEYDKLLDVEAIPMPDGQLCLLTLPPECCQGEGPEAVPYLKLFCRYITDCKGVVSGILLVTSNKLFFDPCKSHPLVVEHGCEEYLLSCTVDSLASVALFSDITHVRFSQSQHRWKGKRSTLKGTPHTRGSHDSLKSNTTKQEAGALALASAGPSDPQPGPSDPRPGPASGDDRDGGTASGDASEAKKHPETPAEGAAPNSAATTTTAAAEVKASESSDEAKPNAQDPRSRGRSAAAPGGRPPNVPGGVVFVRLRPQRPLEETAAGRQRGTSRTVARRDAWLALSQESSDELYAYLSHWRPELCVLDGGEEDGEGEAYEEEFVLIEDVEDVAKSPRHSGEDWELCTELPPRTIGHAWQLTYSTSRHGFSLKSLYRRLSGTDSPVLIVIKDALDQVFGSFLSHPLRPSETFYGTGETFLFMLHPRFKCFRWTGENTFFIKGNLDSFAIGGGSGHFGLWLDETLYLGRSSPCYTFNNCCLSEVDDFHVIEMEASLRKAMYVEVEGSSNPPEKLNVAPSSSGFMAVWSRK
ncbi:Oxidation resistance protein 1 [Merluccius polli]|uniref:Oxidation resistance protein 1 n=1 Tax=Merluccius polli TaxID=89951 RepID=A0AA47N6W7_MERPO|nr:Oxidation resistance protein 1 [Merluccius polli]